MNNPFSNPAFSMAALTAAINILPNRCLLYTSDAADDCPLV